MKKRVIFIISKSLILKWLSWRQLMQWFLLPPSHPAFPRLAGFHTNQPTIYTYSIRVKEKNLKLKLSIFKAAHLNYFKNNLEAGTFSAADFARFEFSIQNRISFCFLASWKCNWISESLLQYLTKCNFFLLKTRMKFWWNTTYTCM